MEKALYDATLATITPIGVQDTYASITGNALKLTGATFGSLFLYDRNEDAMKRVYTTSSFLNQIQPRKRGETYKVYFKKKLSLRSIEDIKMYHPKLESIRIQSDLTIPLVDKDKSIGVLSLLSNEHDTFKEDSVQTLQAFTPFATASLKKTFLYRSLTRSIKYRDYLLNTAAHELKNHITTISLYSHMIQKKDHIDTILLEKYIKKVTNELHRITKLINDFLNIEQVEISDTPYTFKICDLQEIVSQAIRSFKLMNVSHGITYRNTSVKENFSIYADYEKLLQAVINLLHNASKFSPKDSRISMKIEKKNGIVTLRVQDPWIVIPKTEFSTIFENFYKKTTAKKKLSDLQLFFVKSIVDQHDGTITTASTLKKGTTFTITLPLYNE
ncbi:MAG TPA: GAF domain-containing sensor histidine kinase [Candidatus Saccharimonadales bacterium]|nr:GAF domain-containing sensor histidine kinase [Candidatus Saccharimonadales bacterium]